MNGARDVRVRRRAEDVDFIRFGLVAVLGAASFLLHATVGDGGTTPFAPGAGAGAAFQLVVAFTLLAAGLALIVLGVLLGDARPHAFVWRVADAAAAMLLDAAGPGPGPLLRLLLIILYPFFLDFIW